MYFTNFAYLSSVNFFKSDQTSNLTEISTDLINNKEKREEPEEHSEYSIGEQITTSTISFIQEKTKKRNTTDIITSPLAQPNKKAKKEEKINKK